MHEMRKEFSCRRWTWPSHRYSSSSSSFHYLNLGGMCHVHRRATLQVACLHIPAPFNRYLIRLARPGRWVCVCARTHARACVLFLNLASETYTYLTTCNIICYSICVSRTAVAEWLVHLSTITVVQIQSPGSQDLFFSPVRLKGRPGLINWVPDNFRNFRGTEWEGKVVAGSLPRGREPATTPHYIMAQNMWRH